MKRFFEMIFIFIFPVLLLLLGVSVNYTYDENGNVLEKELEYNNIFEFNEDTYNYYSLNKSFIEIEMNTVNDLVNINASAFMNNSEITIYSKISGNTFLSLVCGGGLVSIDIYGVESFDEDLNILWNWDVLLFEDDLTMTLNFENLRFYYEDEIGISQTLDILASGENVIVEYVPLIEDEIEFSYNKLSKTIYLLFNSLGIANNIYLELIVIYLLLMIIMFILWHLVYRPLDFLIHLLKIKGENKNE